MSDISVQTFSDENLEQRLKEERERREFLRDSKFLPLDNRAYLERVYAFQGANFAEVVNYTHSLVLEQEFAIVVEDRDNKFHVWRSTLTRHAADRNKLKMDAVLYVTQRAQNALRSAVIQWVCSEPEHTTAVIASKNYTDLNTAKLRLDAKI